MVSFPLRPTSGRSTLLEKGDVQRCHDSSASSACLWAPKTAIWKCFPLPQLCHCLHWFLQAWSSLIYLDRQIFGFLPLIAMALLLAPIWRSPLAWKLDILLMGKNTRFVCASRQRSLLQVRSSPWSSWTLKEKKTGNLRYYAIKRPTPSSAKERPFTLRAGSDTHKAGSQKMNRLWHWTPTPCSHPPKPQPQSSTTTVIEKDKTHQ